MPTGTNPTYITATGHRPLPPKVRPFGNQPKRQIPTGLDWGNEPATEEPKKRRRGLK